MKRELFEAESAESAESKKNRTKIPSAFLCELGGENFGFCFPIKLAVYQA
jgi:hypothetical protein